MLINKRLTQGVIEFATKNQLSLLCKIEVGEKKRNRDMKVDFLILH